MKQGVKEHIQSVTKDNPWYALVSGALQGLPVDYSATQHYVDQIAATPPEKWLDPDKNATFLNSIIKGVKKQRFQFSRQRAPLLAEMAKCYLGYQALGFSPRDAAWNCAGPVYKGVKRKNSNLMREYLGDENAVAADRHVFTYVCVKKGVCPPYRKTNKGIMVPDSSQAIVEDEIRRIARECGKKPIDVQVAAWLRGTCDSRRTRRSIKDQSVNMGRDAEGRVKVIHCAKKIIEARDPGETTPSVIWKKLPKLSYKVKGVDTLDQW